MLVACGASGSSGHPEDDASQGGSSTSGGSGSGGTSSGGSVSAGGTSGGTATTGGSGGSTLGSGGSSESGGAGNSGNGGSGASGGNPNHVFGQCDDLGEVGTWENITPDAGIGTVAAFAVAPSNPSIVYLTSCGQGIFKTTDCGANFVRIDDGESEVEGPASNCAWTMEVDPTNPDIVYTNMGYGPTGVRKSTDGGVHWEQVFDQTALDAFIYGGFTENISIDPTDPLHLVATPHFSCQAPYDENCLVESTDGGESWTVVEDTPGIGEGDGIVIGDADSWFWGQPFGGIYRSTNQGDSWQKVTSESAGFRFIQQASDGNWYSPGLYGVLVSSDDGASWEHVQNGPNSDSFATMDGKLFTSRMPGNYYWASLDDPSVWTEIVKPAENVGAWMIRVDPDHHLLFTTSANSGFWRVRME
jgi:hypothetical protein